MDMPDWWSWANAWSAATAVGTVAMAVVTYRIIRQNTRQSADIERHHQDRFKPICVLRPYDGIDPWNRRDTLLESRAPEPNNPSFGTIAIMCTLENVGVGTALNLRLKFRFLDMGGWSTEPWELSPLPDGKSIGTQGAPLLVPIRLHDQFNGSDFAGIVGKAWEIWLEYEDVFGRRFRTVHQKRPLQLDRQTPIPGSSTQMYAPPQPWMTFTAI